MAVFQVGKIGVTKQSTREFFLDFKDLHVHKNMNNIYIFFISIAKPKSFSKITVGGRAVLGLNFILV